MTKISPSWPSWLDLTEEAGEQREDLVNFKRVIVDKFGPESIAKSWVKVCQELESITSDSANCGTAAIPDIEFEDIVDLSDKKNAKGQGRWWLRCEEC
jgi:hypothetical protein